MLNNAVIDLSHHNDKPMDFDAAKADGVVGIIHKVTEGTSFVDGDYDSNKRAALAAGLLWGAYHFLRPGDMEAQAEFFVEMIGEDIDIYAADHEDPDVSLEDLKEFCAAVAKRVKGTVIIYSGHVLKEQLGEDRDEELSEYPLWLAQYTSGSPSWPEATWPNWWLWQFTDEGPAVDGIPLNSGGYLDLNRYDGPAEDLMTEWTGGERVPPRPPRPPPHPDEVVVHVKVTAPPGVKFVVERVPTSEGLRSEKEGVTNYERP